jgi:hypothetical protein
MAFKQDPKDPKSETPASSEGDGGQELDLKSSKQLADAGIEVTDWQAKYNGLVGSVKQLVAKHNTALAQKDAKIQELEGSVETLEALKPQAERAAELETQLAAEKANGSALDVKSKKQEVLLQYPVLTAPTKDGKPNPMYDVLMSANLEPEAFATKAAELAALDWSAGQPLRSGGTPPPPPPQGGLDTPDSWQQKALDAHEKFIRSGRKDKQAEKDEAEAWAKHRELSK